LQKPQKIIDLTNLEGEVDFFLYKNSKEKIQKGFFKISEPL